MSLSEYYREAQIAKAKAAEDAIKAREELAAEVAEAVMYRIRACEYPMEGIHLGDTELEKARIGNSREDIGAFILPILEGITEDGFEVYVTQMVPSYVNDTLIMWEVFLDVRLQPNRIN